ncbi:MAG TPA: hypothetical protein DCQ98_13195 [Planctomycetaceae bacterium]|nr:hypothetical protein [Planctomycetaceae bacterium]
MLDGSEQEGGTQVGRVGASRATKSTSSAIRLAAEHPRNHRERERGAAVEEPIGSSFDLATNRRLRYSPRRGTAPTGVPLDLR